MCVAGNHEILNICLSTNDSTMTNCSRGTLVKYQTLQRFRHTTALYKRTQILFLFSKLTPIKTNLFA